jgi:hypothetical protein
MKDATAPALTLLAALAFAPGCLAQGPPMDPARQQAVIDKTLELVAANYVFPDKVKAVETALRANVRSGTYGALSKPDDFLEALNRDMEAAASDKHLRIVRNPRIVAQLKREASGPQAVSPEFLAMLRDANFRLRKVESLDGNVGYFKFDNFVELRFVEEPLVGAMNFLHASSALVLDLTDNGGGAGETVDFLLGYFLPDGTRTGETWTRATNETKVSIVKRSPRVEPMLDTPLYVLVSERTASAAEALAYTLQQAKRAVVVGSRTKGMANPGRQFVIDDRLFVVVPTIVGRNAVSGTNWEGAGIVPDIASAPEHALDAAMADALKRLASGRTEKKERARLLFFSQDHAARLSLQTPPAGFLEATLGEYEGGQRIAMKDGSPHYLKGETDRRLTYWKDDTFLVEGRRDYRLKFPFAGGRVARLEVLWFDDTSDTYRRTN